ncbi:hypothetical protein HELRODRAFT_177829 [Helobdella robusta]|uniref:Methyltransferase domain-containing protein n=1 Tax=Helobdella robusta TaxID=6412 RepID=T1FCC2_HELRO|nr:hypothetical protein HELRODRAFT_177829 [Helobdella robusta]ESN97766.1 hypothetical protein HELRODRAFT_177829 [Helobdella robusta]
MSIFIVSDMSDIYEKLFDEVGKNYLKDVRHAISIGPGIGEADILFLNKTTPNLTKLTAVDKDSSCIEEFRKNLKELFSDDVAVHFHLSPAQIWQGPQERADLVLIFHTSTTYCLNDILRELGRKLHVESYTVKLELIHLGYSIDRVHNFEYNQDLQALHDYVVSFIMIHANPPIDDEELVKKAIKKLIDAGNKGYASGNLFSVIKKS